ncbi:hypothetical protein GSQ22_08605 [Clostridioides difficile]|nr:hypothetical protein [Clostridioides difficile]
MNLEVNERALAAASILVKIEDEEEAMKEAEREKKRGTLLYSKIKVEAK